MDVPGDAFEMPFAEMPFAEILFASRPKGSAPGENSQRRTFKGVPSKACLQRR
jgi:hypothetical protein